MITLRGIGFSYPGSAENECALHSVDMEIAEGSVVSVLGANGSGKSTLAWILNALLLPAQGSLDVDGTQIDCNSKPDKTTIRKIRCSVGMVFQNPENQIVGDTVEQDVAFGPENLGLCSSEIRKRTEKALCLMGLENLRLRSPRQLSGGQLQKLAIAGVLAMDCRYLVLDESLSMLDSKSKSEVLETLGNLNRERNLGIVMISHDIRDCSLAKHIFVFENGTVAMHGTSGEILERRGELRALGIRC